MPFTDYLETCLENVYLEKTFKEWEVKNLELNFERVMWYSMTWDCKWAKMNEN